MLTLCLESPFFSVSVGDCGTGERGHLQNPGRPTGFKTSTVYLFTVFCCPRHSPVYGLYEKER